MLLERAVDAAIADGALRVGDRPACRFEPPDGDRFGDATSRIAMLLARRTGRPAEEIARAIVARMPDPEGWIEALDAAGPGFVNVRASLAFWRAALADRLRGPRPVAPSRGGALVRVDVPSGSDAAPRAALLAETLACLLRAAGHRVALDASPGAADFERMLVIHAATDGRAARRAKRAFGDAAARPGRIATIAVAPATIRRRGRPVPVGDAAEMLRRPGLRLDVLAVPAGEPIDLDAGGARRIDAPWIAIRHARTRIARVAEGPAPDSLDALGQRERECLRAVGLTPDVVALAARRLEPDRLVGHARALAAAFHRYYNRGHFGAEPPVAAQRALARGVGGALDELSAILGAREPERG